MRLREARADGIRLVRLAAEHREGWSDWERPWHGDAWRRQRSYYLGSILTLSPSGKVYTPWACSNLTPCPRCRGRGCDHCGELGSREAHEDQAWREGIDDACSRYGLSWASGGNVCDLYLQEWEDDDGC